MPKKNKKTPTTTVQVAVATKPLGGGPKKQRKKKKSAQKSRMMSERQYFTMALMKPHLTGPVRMPRAGSVRTGLGFDQFEGSMVGTASATFCSFIQAQPLYGTSINKYTAIDGLTGIGTSTGFAPGSQFPAAGNVADLNCTAISLYAYYVGPPLTCQGEVIFGSTIQLLATATFQSLVYYPGTVKFPVANLIDKPYCVAARKLSPVADEFVTVTTSGADFDLPFIAVTGLPNGGAINVITTRCWEYRSTTASGSVVPYEKVGAGHSTDTAAYQDARADIGGLESTLTVAFPESGGSLPGILTSLVSGAAVAGAGVFAKRVHNHLRGGRSTALFGRDGGEQGVRFASDFD